MCRFDSPLVQFVYRAVAVPVSNLTDHYLVRHGQGRTYKLRLTGVVILFNFPQIPVLLKCHDKNVFLFKVV